MIVKKQNRRFTLMAVGEKGSGRSSFFNTLIGKQIISSKKQEEIDLYMLNLDCEGVSQRMTLIDMPGFGETLDDSGLQETICDFIKAQLDMFIAEESKIRRNPKYEDTRVHCMLYFVPSTSSGLKDKDIMFLKKVSGLVNIIPVISKADGLSVLERAEMKERVTEQMKYYGIEMFDLDDPDLCATPSVANNLNRLVPFLIISANKASPELRVKSCKWGDINIDNSSHCDVAALRELLLSTHINGLIDYTASEIYESYRATVLESGIRK
ncbi:septin [Ordospora pajunii]|uniref:septin n=1 Tax=Ordospora pajunii TaxID=3039483 RepID=UPI00295277EC|nr:septin [Ordospora pajunii]KAH9410816.1 septin [Ordospora pajunii]